MLKHFGEASPENQWLAAEAERIVCENKRD